MGQLQCFCAYYLYINLTKIINIFFHYDVLSRESCNQNSGQNETWSKDTALAVQGNSIDGALAPP